MSNGEEKKSAEEPVVRRIDVSKVVSVIPPASELFKKEKPLVEKRIRVRYDESLSEDVAKIHKDLANALGVTDKDLIEIVVAGRRKFVYKPLIVDNIDVEAVYCNPINLRKNGVADNSIATVRKAQK